MKKSINKILFKSITPFVVHNHAKKLHYISELFNKQKKYFSRDDIHLTEVNNQLSNEIDGLLQNIYYVSELVSNSDNEFANIQTFTAFEILNESIKSCSRELHVYPGELKVIRPKNNEVLIGNVKNLLRIITLSIKTFIKLSTFKNIIIKFNIEKKSKYNRMLHMIFYTKINKANSEMLSRLSLKNPDYIKYCNKELIPLFYLYYAIISLDGLLAIKIKNQKMVMKLVIPLTIYKRKQMENPKNKLRYTGNYNHTVTDIIHTLSTIPAEPDKTVVSQSHDVIFSPQHVTPKKYSSNKNGIVIMSRQGDGYNIINQHGQINLLGQIDQFGSLDLHGQMYQHGRPNVYAQSQNTNILIRNNKI